MEEAKIMKKEIVVEIRRKVKSVSVKSILIIVFILIMIITLFITNVNIFYNWQSAAHNTSTKIVNDLNSVVLDEVEEFISNSVHLNHMNEEIIRNSVVNFNNQVEREKFFVGSLKTHSKEIYSFSFGTENGEYYGARRINGNIEIMRNDQSTGGNSWYYSVDSEMKANKKTTDAGKFDPRTRGWYIAAKNAEKPVFSDVYRHFVIDDLAVSISCPIYNDENELQGVLGTHFTLSSFNDYLKNVIKQDLDGYAIIAEKKSGYLIANSFDFDNYTLINKTEVKRQTLQDTNKDDIIKSYNAYLSEGKTDFLVNNQFVKINQFENHGLSWVIIYSLPRSPLMEGFTLNIIISIIVVFISISLSILIYLFIIKRLFTPITDLKEAAEKFSYGDLSKRIAPKRNDEISRISLSFNKMADRIQTLVENLEQRVEERTRLLKQANKELKDSKDHLHLILDSTAEAIYGIDKNGICTFLNASCLRILGYSNFDELVGHRIHDKIHYSYKDGRPMPAEQCKAIKGSLEGQQAHVDDEVFWKADGTSIDVEYYSYPQYLDGEVVGAVITFMDITKRKKDNAYLEYLNTHDTLSGFYNRRYFEENVKSLDVRDNLPISVIYADVNGLKMTNDIFGHSQGDMLIINSSKILREACRGNDFIARLGGDEFVIVLPKTKAADAENIINRIKEELNKQPLGLLKNSISFGFDTKTKMSQDFSDVISNAENNMYKEKAMSKKNNSKETLDIIINALHQKSTRIKQHSITVKELCKKIGIEMNMSPTELKKLEQAAYLHDIGKITLVDRVLEKNMHDKVDTELVHQHAVVGFRILNLFDETLDLADVVYSHHEKWDGSGYPKGLKGNEIPVMARIIAIAEAYDALTNEFSENPLSKEEALKQIDSRAGKTLDPEITKLFINIMQ